MQRYNTNPCPVVLTNAGHAAQVAVLEGLGLGRLQLACLRIQHARQVLPLLLRHLQFLVGGQSQSVQRPHSTDCVRAWALMLLR